MNTKHRKSLVGGQEGDENQYFVGFLFCFCGVFVLVFFLLWWFFVFFFKSANTLELKHPSLTAYYVSENKERQKEGGKNKIAVFGNLGLLIIKSNTEQKNNKKSNCIVNLCTMHRLWNVVQ